MSYRANTFKNSWSLIWGTSPFFLMSNERSFKHKSFLFYMSLRNISRKKEKPRKPCKITTLFISHFLSPTELRRSLRWKIIITLLHIYILLTIIPEILNSISFLVYENLRGQADPLKIVKLLISQNRKGRRHYKKIPIRFRAISIRSESFM